MKVLLDENLPHGFRREIRGHDVFTVQYLGWSGVKNAELLTRAATSGFDVLLTMDSGVPYQQNVTALPLSIIVLQATSNDLDDLLPLVPKLLDAIRQLKPKTIAWIA